MGGSGGRETNGTVWEGRKGRFGYMTRDKIEGDGDADAPPRPKAANRRESGQSHSKLQHSTAAERQRQKDRCTVLAQFR